MSHSIPRRGISGGKNESSAMRGRPPEGKQLPRERQHQIFAAAENRADAIIGSFRIELEGFRGTQQRGVIDVYVATGSASAHQNPGCLGAARGEAQATALRTGKLARNKGIVPC